MRAGGGSVTPVGLWIVPRRSRCTGCGVTHVLLPVVLLVRRADTVAVIGAGLTAKATGAGHRLIAALLGQPPETVRGWLRRFAGRVEPVRVVFSRWYRALAPDPVLPGLRPATWVAWSEPASRTGPAGSTWADAIAAISAAAAAVGARFGIGCDVGMVPLWQVATTISAARLLLPGWPAPAGGADQHELTLTWADLPR
jgi:hypothetical protein